MAVDPTGATAPVGELGGRRSLSTRAGAPASAVERNRNAHIVAPRTSESQDHAEPSLGICGTTRARPCRATVTNWPRNGRSGARTFAGFPTGNLLGIPPAHPSARFRRDLCAVRILRARLRSRRVAPAWRRSRWSCHVMTPGAVASRDRCPPTPAATRWISRWLSRSVSRRRFVPLAAAAPWPP